MSEKKKTKLFFIKYRAIGLVNSPMKDLANLFRKYENSLISSDNFDVFERVFNDFMKGYRGRAKLPVFKFYKGYPLVKIFVDNGTDTSKSAIYLDLHLVRGVVYTPPIKVLLTKLNANLPISDNEIILAKLAIELGDLGEE